MRAQDRLTAKVSPLIGRPEPTLDETRAVDLDQPSIV